MYRRILKSVLLTSLAAFVAAPATAQIHAEIGPLHIRISGEAPPRARYERRPPRPNRGDVWIGGYWDRQGDNWAWSTGRWERPVYRNAHWVKARYSRDGNRWRYEPAHWSNERLVEGDDYRQWREERDRQRHHRR